MESITVYSTGCPRCIVLLKKLEQKKITWVNIVSDIEIMKKIGIMSVPMMSINDGPLMTFDEAIKWVNNQEEYNGDN